MCLTSKRTPTNNLVVRLEERSRVFWVVLSLVLILGIGFFDYKTGYELSFSLLYLLPISLTTWFAGRSIGIVASVIGACIWFAADLFSGHPYSHPAMAYWNSLIRFGIFLIVTLLLAALRKAHDQEKVLARIDDLTGAVNSRFFYELVQIEMDRFQRNNRPFTVAYIDLDNFKSINDRFGHNMGDKVLRTTVRQAKNQLRKIDIVGRLGGDEFVLLLPETDQAAARAAVYKIQISLLDAMRRNQWAVTFSIGVLTCIQIPQSIDELLTQADHLMYLVKKQGKNSISFSVYKG
jgi:diguanylate cyclase (GGDEF)-like protein